MTLITLATSTPSGFGIDMKGLKKSPFTKATPAYKIAKMTSILKNMAEKSIDKAIFLRMLVISIDDILLCYFSIEGSITANAIPER